MYLQCASCLATVDIASMIRRGPGGGDLVLHQCRQCRKYDQTGDGKRFVHLEPEGPEMMAVLLKHIPALGKNDHHVRRAGVGGLKIVDSSFVWTEPNSMRMRVLLTLRAEVNDVSIQQRVKVEFVVQWKQCPDCTKESRQRTWQAIVQLRQKRDDSTRRGLLILELAIARNALIRKDILSVQTKRNGFDFYFPTVDKARHFAQYLARAAPMRARTTQALISEDSKNNTANVRTTIVCDMVPLCRDDLIVVQRRAKGVGNLSGRLCLVLKMSSAVHLVDASPARDSDMNSICADLHAEGYWKGGEDKTYRAFLSSKRLIRFVVLDVERCRDDDRGRHRDDDGNEDEHKRGQIYQGLKSGVSKYALADVEVARESDFGVNDETFQCVTHLGYLLQVGDIVMGYDVTSTVLPSEAEENAFNSTFVMPDVVLVRKVKGSGSTREPSSSEATDTVAGNEGDRNVKGKAKAKSSASKKRERRVMKEEQKQRKLEEAAARMGLNTDKDVHMDLDDFEVGCETFSEETQIAKFEEQIEMDDEFAEDLDIVERELASGMENLVTRDEDEAYTEA
jgi:nonsense-mediated mRNA decay protein 3